MAETSDDEEATDIHDSPSHGLHSSVVRGFLESGQEFVWPIGYGDITGNHCELRSDIPFIPLKWIRNISQKSKASIDLYKAEKDRGFDFEEQFVVKAIRSDRKREKNRALAKQEIENMKDLRHPHVSVLLGSFTYQTLLYILIFPAARCDLDRFMNHISKLIRTRRQIEFHDTCLASTGQSDGTITPESTRSGLNSSPPDVGMCRGNGHVSTCGKTRGKDLPFPFCLPLNQILDVLRQYFVCLSEALRYLHEQNVRHKDIKPGNILIDKYGAIMLTDFGISKKFPKNSPHATNDERPQRTPKWAAPEIMADERKDRDDPSDVFSLGCVFLQMATLILRRSLEELALSYIHRLSESAIEDAFYYSLPKVYEWIDHLKHPRHDNVAHESLEQRFRGTDDQRSDQTMIDALPSIRKMLDFEPHNRPKSRGCDGKPVLWECFKDVSPSKCRDCDPRRKADIWRPTIREQEAVDLGTRRRSMLLEADREEAQHGHLGDINYTLLHPQPSSRFPVHYTYPSGKNSFSDANESISRGTSLALSRPTHHRNTSDSPRPSIPSPLSPQPRKTKTIDDQPLREPLGNDQNLADHTAFEATPNAINGASGNESIMKSEAKHSSMGRSISQPTIPKAQANSQSVNQSPAAVQNDSHWANRSSNRARINTQQEDRDKVLVFDCQTTKASKRTFREVKGMSRSLYTSMFVLLVSSPLLTCLQMYPISS